MLDQSKCLIPERFKDHPLFNEIHCGMNLGFMARRGYYSREDIQKQPAVMAATGVNWTTLNLNICQEAYYSRKVFLDFEFSSGEEELKRMADLIHEQSIRILFKPCLTPLDSAWMGSVTFPEGRQIQEVEIHYWDEWFDSYTKAICFCADFAEKNKIEAMMIGAELYGTEGQSDRWRKLIQRVRERFSGPITYEFTPLSRKNRTLDWFSDIDFLSYSYYPPATDLIDPASFPTAPKVTRDEMVAFLSDRKQKIHEISQRFNNMPIAFTEAGVRSAHGCIGQPYNYITNTPYDGEEQAAYMDALFTTFSDLPEWLGLYWWKWDETQNRPHYHIDPNGDCGFTIQGKPAEAVLRKWYGKK
ncbi:MAG: hypothetical protein J6X55_11185 [Victivallales bacterium]|nr:hypothetical protein [Victivallales bacterium]